MVFRNPTNRFAHPAELDDDDIEFLNSLKPWSKEMWDKSFGTSEQHNRRNQIKDKFKTELETIQGNYCAFCGLHLSKVPEVHREHIAPQYKHEQFIFEPENIVLACFFCNKRKGKKKTVITDSDDDYSAVTFKILHPFRDDFNVYLECSYENGELIFSIRDGLTPPQYNLANETIKCVGLNDTDLITERGMRIYYHSLRVSPEADEMVRRINSINRKAS